MTFIGPFCPECGSLGSVVGEFPNEQWFCYCKAREQQQKDKINTNKYVETKGDHYDE